MGKIDERGEHERCQQLGALAQCDALNAGEEQELRRHLSICEQCRAAAAEYALIGRDGMPALMARDQLSEEARRWDSRQARNNLLDAVRRERRMRLRNMLGGARQPSRSMWPLRSCAPWNRSVLRAVQGALAACALLGALAGSYRLGVRKAINELGIAKPVMEVAAKAPEPARLAGVASNNVQVARLEHEMASEQQKLAQLRAASIANEERTQQHIDELGKTDDEKDAAIANLNAERDRLAAQLAESEQAYRKLQTEYNDLNAEHNRNLLHTASLEAEVRDTDTAGRDRDKKLKDDEQYLASDRDIRELMGARKLYIADVFDVDGVSRTRKPFGRVFYTESKSLIFYAFDLDHEPGAKNTSVFQVWGQRDAEANAARHPMNLGILYMDSETNRRWVLRSDDPRQLAEIDAVFVTVEPHGGSEKPTGKPLLYALLRKEANHP
jgi:hypothetical protein